MDYLAGYQSRAPIVVGYSVLSNNQPVHVGNTHAGVANGDLIRWWGQDTPPPLPANMATQLRRVTNNAAEVINGYTNTN